MASNVYHEGWKKIMNGTIDLATDQIDVALVNSGYSYLKTHDFMDDVVAGEIDATNYTRKTLASKQIDISTDYIYFDAADVLWTALGGTTNDTVVAAVVHKYNASDAAAELIAYIDFGDKTTDGNNFTLQWNSDGIFRVDNAQA